MLILERNGIRTRLRKNGAIIGDDMETRILIMANISYAPWEGDPHLTLAVFFRQHPELGVKVIKATVQSPYDPDVIY